MSGLRAIGRNQAQELDAFLASGEAGLLARLARSECLLGVARLSALRMDLVSYAGMVVGVITQFVPCRACQISLEVADVPPILITYGELPDPVETGPEPLKIDDVQIGELFVVAEAQSLSPPDFLSALSEQISSSLGALVEAERLRRQAAVAQTIHLAEALSDHATPEDLTQLVNALASLPNAVGARLEIVHPAVGGPVLLTAGAVPLNSGETLSVPGGSISVAVRWSAAAQSRDRESLGEVIAMLARALEKAEERRQLRDEAETDTLTGIGNRRRAVRALAAAIDLAERTAESVGVLYLDLDHFKRVNDALGHEVGDQVLARFADHLNRMVRSYDTVSRFGGEEFLIVCPGLDDVAGASLSRRMIEATPAACSEVLPEGWRQTASAGLACYPDAADHLDGVLRAADQALYAAKHGGRNQVRLASEINLHH